MLSDDTRVKEETWRVLKITMADLAPTYISNIAMYSEAEQELLKELIKAQQATGDSQGKLEPTPNPLYTDSDKKFDPFEDDDEMEKEDPTLDDVSPLHKKISEQEPSNMDVDEEEEDEEPEELSLDSILNGLIKK